MENIDYHKLRIIGAILGIVAASLSIINWTVDHLYHASVSVVKVQLDPPIVVSQTSVPANTPVAPSKYSYVKPNSPQKDDPEKPDNLHDKKGAIAQSGDKKMSVSSSTSAIKRSIASSPSRSPFTARSLSSDVRVNSDIPIRRHRHSISRSQNKTDHKPSNSETHSHRPIKEPNIEKEATDLENSTKAVLHAANPD